MNVIKNQKTAFFAAGVLVATAGVKFLKSKTFRNGCVKTIASGMKLKKDAAASIDKVKEEAQDMCYDAEQECDCNCDCDCETEE